jgi:hypothetical protein
MEHGEFSFSGVDVSGFMVKEKPLLSKEEALGIYFTQPRSISRISLLAVLAVCSDGS